MSIVFDEIVSEVQPPAPRSPETGGRQTDARDNGGLQPQVELQRVLDRIRIRQLRLMAD